MGELNAAINGRSSTGERSRQQSAVSSQQSAVSSSAVGRQPSALRDFQHIRKRAFTAKDPEDAKDLEMRELDMDGMDRMDEMDPPGVRIRVQRNKFLNRGIARGPPKLPASAWAIEAFPGSFDFALVSLRSTSRCAQDDKRGAVIVVRRALAANFVKKSPFMLDGRRKLWEDEKLRQPPSAGSW